MTIQTYDRLHVITHLQTPQDWVFEEIMAKELFCLRLAVG